MKIGIDASRAFVSLRTGTENYSYQLIKAMAKIDRKNQYVLYTRPHPDLLLKGEGNIDYTLSSQERVGVRFPNIEVKPISLPRLWTQIGLAKEVMFNPPDVLFVPAHTLPAIRRPGLKTVVTIHDLGYEYLPQYHQFPQKLYLNKSTEYAVKHATQLIAVSQATKTDLMKKLGCPKEKITVIYEGFDQNRFNQKQNLKINNLKLIKNLKLKTKNYILFVGTLQPRKNVERLIEAFSLVLRSPKFLKSPNTPNLVIAGNKGWLYDKILSAPKRFGVEDRVKFLGYTQEDDLPTLYQNALCFCLPSLFEGFGLPVLEAMACGCPVIVSNTSSLPEVAGEAGIYVNPLDVNGIAKKLEMVIGNKLLRNELVARGLTQAKKFSWEKCARETINVLKKTSCLPDVASG